MASVQDKLNSVLNTASRKLFDYDIKMKGREVSVIRVRITQTAEDRYYRDETIAAINSESIQVVFIFPGEIPLSRYRKAAPDVNGVPGATDQQADATGTFFYEILPIEMYTKWGDQVEKGDLLLFTLTDENGSPIKLLFQICEVLGQFNSSLIWKKSQCAPYSGTLPAGVQAYIDTVEQETLRSVVYDPNGATSGTVPVDSTQYAPGDQAVVLGNPGLLERPGYRFIGWAKEP